LAKNPHYTHHPKVNERYTLFAATEKLQAHGRLVYDCTTMRWGNFLGFRSKTLPIWAALCTGRADGSDQKYSAQAKHAILAMVRAEESDAENAICSLLQSNGWREPTIQNVKKLAQPFRSDDPIMRDCHERATKSGTGIVVYSDPIEEA
jgi:hypothetical protein